MVRDGACNTHYLWLSAKLEEDLARQLAGRHPLSHTRELSVRVVNNPHAAVIEPVALEAARWLKEMISEVHARQPDRAVHIGFSSGVTAKLISRALALL